MNPLKGFIKFFCLAPSFPFDFFFNHFFTFFLTNNILCKHPYNNSTVVTRVFPVCRGRSFVSDFPGNQW